MYRSLCRGSGNWRRPCARRVVAGLPHGKSGSRKAGGLCSAQTLSPRRTTGCGRAACRGTVGEGQSAGCRIHTLVGGGRGQAEALCSTPSTEDSGDTVDRWDRDSVSGERVDTGELPACYGPPVFIILNLRGCEGWVIARCYGIGRKVRTPWAGRWVTPRRSNPTPAPQKLNRRWPTRRDPIWSLWLR